MRWPAVIAMIGIATVLAGCELFGFRSWDWNQKLIVEVETPSGPVIGASVVHVHREQTPEWLAGIGGGGMGYAISGEATVVEVLPGVYLFALLSGGHTSHGYHAYLPFKVFFPGESTNSVDAAEALEDLRSGKDVDREDYPLLVMFTDIGDPMSVREVDPDNLAATFGAGYRLKAIALEITEEPVTTGRVEKLLGWLGPHPEPALGPQADPLNPPFYRKVHHGDFIRSPR